MKNIILTSLLTLFTAFAYSQNWEGTYRLGDPDIKESSLGILQIKQISAKEIQFSLQFTDQNLKANIAGKMAIDASKTAIYFFENTKSKTPCSFILQSSAQEIFLTQESAAESCGFSSNVDISGTYHQISKASNLK